MIAEVLFAHLSVWGKFLGHLTTSGSFHFFLNPRLRQHYLNRVGYEVMQEDVEALAAPRCS